MTPWVHQRHSLGAERTTFTERNDAPIIRDRRRPLRTSLGAVLQHQARGNHTTGCPRARDLWFKASRDNQHSASNISEKNHVQQASILPF